MLRGALALGAGGHRDVRAAERRRVVVLLGRGLALIDPEIARLGGQVARLRGVIAGKRERVTLVGGAETRTSGLVALTSGLVARTSGLVTLLGGVLADALAEIVRPRAATGLEVAVARSLLIVGSILVAVGARLVAV